MPPSAWCLWFDVNADHDRLDRKLMSAGNDNHQELKFRYGLSRCLLCPK